MDVGLGNWASVMILDSTWPKIRPLPNTATTHEDPDMTSAAEPAPCELLTPVVGADGAGLELDAAPSTGTVPGMAAATSSPRFVTVAVLEAPSPSRVTTPTRRRWSRPPKRLSRRFPLRSRCCRPQSRRSDQPLPRGAALRMRRASASSNTAVLASSIAPP